MVELRVEVVVSFMVVSVVEIEVGVKLTLEESIKGLCDMMGG